MDNSGNRVHNMNLDMESAANLGMKTLHYTLMLISFVLIRFRLRDPFERILSSL